MKEPLKSLSDVVAQANDLFYERNKTVDTLMGIMDKTLREQGMNADAITIDCVTLNKKIVMVLHDAKPNIVDVALGDKTGAIHASTEHEVNTLGIQEVLSIMESNFIS